MITRGGCHCGAVAFEVDGEPAEIEHCNCSVCTKKGYLHWIIEPERFRLLRGANKLAVYSFNTKVAKHYFCSTCGVASFYIPRSDPDKVDVNARCLEGIDLHKLRVIEFDGRNWETAIELKRKAAGTTVDPSKLRKADG
jgi:hypothetical protein